MDRHLQSGSVLNVNFEAAPVHRAMPNFIRILSFRSRMLLPRMKIKLNVRSFSWLLRRPARADRARSGLGKQKTGTRCGSPGLVGMCCCTDRNCSGPYIPPLAFQSNPPARIRFPQPDYRDHSSRMSGRAFAGNGLCEPQKSVSGLRTGQTINAGMTESSRGLEGQRVGYDKSQSGLYALKLTPRYRAPSRAGLRKADYGGRHGEKQEGFESAASKN